ncbi:MAG: xanthine dehydrogenase small subunit [Verrucomicrobiota bacterium]
MNQFLEFVLNGRPVRVENRSPNTTVLEYLRGIGCTGTKEGCAEGDCGACSIVIVEQRADGKNIFRAVNSCLMPLPLIAGRTVITVEGVANGELHAVQRAMVQNNGSQCGYCTPGIVMSMLEGFYRDDLKEPWQIDDQLCGNLCRCTGYRPIRDAAIEAFAQKRSGSDHFAGQLERGSAELSMVEYFSTDEKFYRPGSLASLFRLLADNPDARLIAGATELGLEITKRYRKFATLISVEAVPELKESVASDLEWRIGAAVTLTQLEEALVGEFPPFAKMLAVFGSRQIRNRATLGGNLVTASPIGDSAPVLIAYNAKVVLASAGGERVLELEKFFQAYRKTALQPGEILKTILLPRARLQTECKELREFYKVSKRREMDISTVAACFAVDLDERNVVQAARLVYGGVAATTMRARKTEAALLGKIWSAETVVRVLPVLGKEFTPISDVRGSAAYRENLITRLFQKFFHEGAKGVAPRISIRSPNRAAKFARARSHDSAHKHVTGEAIYADDEASQRITWEAWPVCSPHARARIINRDVSEAKKMPGIRAVILAEDIPGLNDIGTKHDEPLLADKEVYFHGQLIALVVGESLAACRAAAGKVIVEYLPLAPILTIEEAIIRDSFHNEPNFIRRGNVETALGATPQIMEGEFSLGGQEHFYLEMQAAWAEPGEDGSVFVVSSTQHPSEVQAAVAHVLDLPCNQVIVQCPRMGGGFGGKETQAATPAALVALAARITGSPVRLRYNRDQDMMLTGKRHPFLAKFKVGFDADGMLLAAKAEIFSNGGWALDLSQAVTDRALFHFDNCYYIPAVELKGLVAKTNLVSNTAFRGFGGPQGMLIIEEIIDRIARRLGVLPENIREKNLYRGQGETNTTHYGQEIEDNRIQTIWETLKTSAEISQRRDEIRNWNGQNPHAKRGIAMTPVKFGISFTVTHLNQAGAFVLIYQDGTVQLNHGGTEMGQGLHTNIAAIAANELGIDVAQIRIMHTSTDKVPNTSATAASAGTDLNGAAVRNACEILRARLSPIAAELLHALSSDDGKVSPEPDLTRGSPPDDDAPEPARREIASEPNNAFIFAEGFVRQRDQPKWKVSFVEVVKKAYLERVCLSATGFYATPGIHWDRVAGRGKPFHYFSNGAAVTEVEVDGFTGMTQVLRTDILHDAGNSINEGVNRGQIEGGFVQGMGWLTSEELKWDSKGQLLTHSPDTYKIPAVGDTPKIFNVNFLKNAAQKNVVYGSKAVGEPPLMLAISVREAIRDAVAAFGEKNSQVPLASPATAEAIFSAIQRIQS